MTPLPPFASMRRAFERLRMTPLWHQAKSIWTGADSNEQVRTRDARQLATGLLVASLFAVALARSFVATGTTLQSQATHSSQAGRRPQESPRPQSLAVIALRDGEPVNINAATASDLQLLPGIGPSLASRLITYRTEHGRFHSIDELINVRGIGPKMLNKLQRSVAVFDEPGAK